jgi:hypothetical protein
LVSSHFHSYLLLGWHFLIGIRVIADSVPVKVLHCCNSQIYANVAMEEVQYLHDNRQDKCIYYIDNDCPFIVCCFVYLLTTVGSHKHPNSNSNSCIKIHNDKGEQAKENIIIFAADAVV